MAHFCAFETKNGTALVNYSYLVDGTKLSALQDSGEGLVYRGPFVYRKSTGPGIFYVRSDLYGKVSLHTNWHTHPSYVDGNSKPSNDDLEFKRAQSIHGLKRFIILTWGSTPIEY